MTELPSNWTAHDAGLWSRTHALRVGGLLPLGTRTTVLAHADGGLLVHSPGRLTAEDHAFIRGLGEVRWLVAPNREHNLFIADAAQAFPEAEVWVAPGVEAKIPESRLSGVLTPGLDSPFGDSIDTLFIEGCPRMAETVLVHTASRTLVTADLSFHITEADSWLDRSMLKMAGAYGKFGPSTLFRTWYLQDRPAFKRSLDELLERDFDRVVLAHGRPLEMGGKLALESILVGRLLGLLR